MASKNPKSDAGGDATSRAEPTNASNEPREVASESSQARADPTRGDAGKAASGTSPADVASAYSEFMKRMAEASNSLEKQYNEQLTAYISTLRDTERQVSDVLTQAVQRYREQLQAAWSQGELAGKVTEAYQRFVKLSEEHASQGDLQRMVTDAYANFVSGLGPAGTSPAAGSLQERHRNYLDALQKASDNTELHKRALEAHAEYLLLLQQLQQQGWQRTQEAQQAYDSSIRESLSSIDLPKRINEAFEQSIGVLQQAWQQACKQYNEESAHLAKLMEAGGAMPSPFASPGQGA